MLARLFVVLLVEAPDQLFENCPYRVVVEARVLHRAVAVQNGIRAEVDVRRKKPFDESAKGISLGQARKLVAKLEVLQDFLYIGREPVHLGNNLDRFR